MFISIKCIQGRQHPVPVLYAGML